MKLSWSEAESNCTRSGGVAEYRRRPVLRQELKGKEELSHHFIDMHQNLSVSFNNAKIGVLGKVGMTLSGTLL